MVFLEGIFMKFFNFDPYDEKNDKKTTFEWLYYMIFFGGILLITALCCAIAVHLCIR